MRRKLASKSTSPRPAGMHRLWLQGENGVLLPLLQQANQIQWDWGYVAARLFGFADKAFLPSTIYLEFKNVVSPGDTVAVPSYDRDSGVEYYDNLSVSSTQDYLRVPLRHGPALSVASGYDSYFSAEGAGNVLSFMGITTGSVGVHGKTFATNSNSKIYGAALVATPDEGDPSKDLIIARTYYQTGDQVIKDAVRQFVPTWELAFK